MDYACSNDVCCKKEWFDTYDTCGDEVVKLANGDCLDIVGKGTMKIKMYIVRSCKFSGSCDKVCGFGFKRGWIPFHIYEVERARFSKKRKVWLCVCNICAASCKKKSKRIAKRYASHSCFPSAFRKDTWLECSYSLMWISAGNGS